MKLTALLCLILFSVLSSRGDDTSTCIFDDSFKTLEVKVDDDDMLPPVIALDSDDFIRISFDRLAEERDYLRYSIVHCNAFWQPSGLVETEFLDGFNEGEVEDYAFSEATTVHYVHYSITLPNDRIKFKISGNYLLKVFYENNPEDVLLQVRFMVSESAVKITGGVTTATDVDYNEAHQQVSLCIDAGELDVDNLYNDLIVTVAQNYRNDDVRVLTSPLRVNGKKIIYEHLRPLIFKAGNEYRRFENISVNYPSMRIARTGYEEPYYHAEIETDYSRSSEPYSYDETHKGRYKIREYNSSDPEVEAEYVLTHFTLDVPEMPGFDIFIDGDLAQRRFDPASRMHYDRGRKAYVGSVLLKQGAYDYQYLAVLSGTMKGLTAPVEGDFYNTSNEYFVNVYLRKPGSRYDRLVGSTVIFTK